MHAWDNHHQPDWDAAVTSQPTSAHHSYLKLLHRAFYVIADEGPRDRNVQVFHENLCYAKLSNSSIITYMAYPGHPY